MLQSQKIILADDVKAFQPTLARASNVSVYTAASGQDVINIHQKEKAALIVLSRYMPGMDGEEACKKIKHSDAMKDVAVVMLLGGVKTEDVEDYINSIGADDYVVKPFTPAEFINKISRFINIPIRQNVRILTKLSVDVKNGTASFIGNTIDISGQGMFLETEKQMDIGNSVKCAFSIPDIPNPIMVTGNVVRKVDGKVPPLKRYGIKFVDLDNKSEMAIEKYVFKQQRQQLRERVR